MAAYPCEHGTYGFNNYNNEIEKFVCEGGMLC